MWCYEESAEDEDIAELRKQLDAADLRETVRTEVDRDFRF